MIAIFNKLCGKNIANFYSNSLFKKSGNSFAPEEITALMGVTNLVSVLICMNLLKYYGRRTLMLWGFAGMAISLTVLGACSLYSINSLLIVSIIVYCFSFEISAGPITWILLAEILEDKAMGLCTGFMWFGSVVISAVIPIIAAAVGPNGTGKIWVGCGISCAFGWIYFYFYLPETKGKTKQEITAIYDVTPSSDKFS